MTILKTIDKIFKEIEKLERIETVVCGKCGQSLDISAVKISEIRKLKRKLKVGKI